MEVLGLQTHSIESVGFPGCPRPHLSIHTEAAFPHHNTME